MSSPRSNFSWRSWAVVSLSRVRRDPCCGELAARPAVAPYHCTLALSWIELELDVVDLSSWLTLPLVRLVSSLDIVCRRAAAFLGYAFDSSQLRARAGVYLNRNL